VPSPEVSAKNNGIDITVLQELYNDLKILKLVKNLDFLYNGMMINYDVFGGF